MESLNPYSTGSWVAGMALWLLPRFLACLNPYSTGSWVAGVTGELKESMLVEVLILILLEVGLLELSKVGLDLISILS